LSYYRSRTSAALDDDAASPYGRAWFPIAAQLGILLAIVVAIYLVFRFFAPTLPRLLVQTIDVALALLPLALWAIFTFWREQRVPQPRPRLLMVMIISGLAANAIGIPLVESVFQVDRWLPLSGTISRVLGYTFTVGITQELIKYVVVRYTVWERDFRVRLDSVVYCASSAIGYATVLNLSFVVNSSANLDITAIRIFDNVALNLAASMIAAFGMSEMRFERPTPFLMPITVALGALVTGIVIPLRTGLSNAGFSAAAAINAPISVIIAVGIILPIALLFSTADRREREARATREP
jgi:hypothetical protein